MLKIWHEQAWADYLWWQETDRSMLRKINRLIRDVERSGAGGRPPGKSEVLRGSRHGLRSVRIDRANRLVYAFEGEESLVILSCRGHYE